MMLIEYDSSIDLGEIINTNKIVFLDFYTPTCGRCKMQKVIFDKNPGDYTVVMIDSSKNRDIALFNKVLGVPNVKVYKNGNLLDKYSGGFLSRNDLLEILGE